MSFSYETYARARTPLRYVSRKAESASIFLARTRNQSAQIDYSTVISEDRTMVWFFFFFYSSKTRIRFPRPQIKISSDPVDRHPRVNTTTRSLTRAVVLVYVPNKFGVKNRLPSPVHYTRSFPQAKNLTFAPYATRVSLRPARWTHIGEYTAAKSHTSAAFAVKDSRPAPISTTTEWLTSK